MDQKKLFSLDRIEEGKAVIYDEDDNKQIIDAALLPKEASEGSMLTFDGQAWAVDAEATEAMKGDAQSLLDKLTQ